MHMDITLREGYGHTLSIKMFFDGAGYIPVNIPVIIGFNPWTDHKIDGGISQLVDLDHGRRIL